MSSPDHSREFLEDLIRQPSPDQIAAHLDLAHRARAEAFSQGLQSLRDLFLIQRREIEGRA
ncbi:MAG: hypothetical protein MRY63_12300 [Neomegalonema sp.]|nr:hypothetical protein [Neomegalonema sp.]